MPANPRPNPLKSKKATRVTKVQGHAASAEWKRRHTLRLFVAGATVRSRQAVLLVQQLCDAEPDGCNLEVIDIYQQPLLARENQIVATPTLIKEFPRPVRRFIGSMLNVVDLFVAGVDTEKRDVPA
jgi:circadian clock protein KaiB